jgi:hypothetical protein
VRLPLWDQTHTGLFEANLAQSTYASFRRFDAKVMIGGIGRDARDREQPEQPFECSGLLPVEIIEHPSDARFDAEAA